MSSMRILAMSDAIWACCRCPGIECVWKGGALMFRAFMRSRAGRCSSMDRWVYFCLTITGMRGGERLEDGQRFAAPGTAPLTMVKEGTLRLSHCRITGTFPASGTFICGRWKICDFQCFRNLICMNVVEVGYVLIAICAVDWFS